MKNSWKPLIISIVISILLLLAIIPWASMKGTLNWQTGPLYLIFVGPVALAIVVVGLILSLKNRTK